jgi:hypothetical protein
MVSHGRNESFADDDAFDGMLEQVAIVRQDTLEHRSLDTHADTTMRVFNSLQLCAPSVCLSSATCALQVKLCHSWLAVVL